MARHGGGFRRRGLSRNAPRVDPRRLSRELVTPRSGAAAASTSLCLPGVTFRIVAGVTLDELRNLAFSIEPISLHETVPEARRDVETFNGLVSKYRELVVRARNVLVLGRPVEPDLAGEIRMLAEALPAERQRASWQARR